MRHLTLLLLPSLLLGQGTLEDYRHSFGLRDEIRKLDLQLADPASPIPGTNQFWYRRSIPGGHAFVSVDPATAQKSPLFDAPRLATALTKATSVDTKPERLPFTTLNFSADKKWLEFTLPDGRWRAHRETYVVERMAGNNGLPGIEGLRGMLGPQITGTRQGATSPDGKWLAKVRNFNIWIQPNDTNGAAKDPVNEAKPLSLDGTEDNAYVLPTNAWSPDSKKLVAYRVRPGQRRKIAYIESSPVDQLQPKFTQLEYAKPGDTLDIAQPVLFAVEGPKAIPVDPAPFPNPYHLGNLEWRKDSRAFTFEYNQRGHQVYRVIEVDAITAANTTAAARALISEEPTTYFCYSSKKFVHHIADGKELVWMSERDGLNHLYLYDGRTGKVKNQITKGNWVVRSVAKVDETKRQIWFAASGMHAGHDPYFQHWFRINFDGTQLTPITKDPTVNHAVVFNEGMTHFIDTHSRVDQPPVAELFRADTMERVATLDRGTDAPLRAIGWRPPEPFVAKGRDGSTDIYGLIFRPYNFLDNRKYPVLEYIYAGPHDSFVPKTFVAGHPMQAMADLGFIVVQMDGMGTSNRSKAFHDVSWKNLGDAGFPDRIAWHKAVAAKYPWYDLNRLGIYGHSAGGQSSLGGMLRHGDFYKAAASSAGCHDNRMDKIWWNEQWMSWPVGQEYIDSSNVTLAHKLQGKLLLAVGELDTNVDPASTMQVVNALIRANKTFDLLFLPGRNHGGWGDYWERKRADFFVRELLHTAPPDWNVIAPPAPSL